MTLPRSRLRPAASIAPRSASNARACNRLHAARPDHRVHFVVRSMHFRGPDLSIPAPMPIGHALPVETEAPTSSLRHEIDGRNLLLDALPSGEYERLRDRLEPVALPAGMPIY